MPDLLVVAVPAAVVLSLVMAGAWLVDRRTGNSGWIDAIWSLAIGVVGVVLALVPFAGVGARQALVAALCGIWSLRLGLHIVQRTPGGDDPRYRHLKDSWGAAFPARLFWFLQIQAAVALALVLTVFLAAHNDAPLRIQDAIGAVVLLGAIAGEALADVQLQRFRARAGRGGLVCDVGLWGLSRHPNYFFQWLGWLAYVPIAIDWGGGYPLGWLTVAAPLLMYWLLVYASGIPPLEAHMLRSRGAAFADYQARVNAFWPGPPRRPAASRPGGARP